MAIPVARLASIPPLVGGLTSSPSGYPWQDGDVLYAADLNEAFLPVEGGGTINGNVDLLGSVTSPLVNCGSLNVEGNTNCLGSITTPIVNAGSVSVPGNVDIQGTLGVAGHVQTGGDLGVAGTITAGTVRATNAVQVGDGQMQMYELGTTSRTFAFSDNWLWNWENATGNLTWDASGSGAFITLKADSPAPNYRGVNWLGPWQGNGAYIATSDERAKTGIEPATVGLREVLEIVPIRFRRNGAGQRTEIGFSAQALASVLPEAVVELGRDDMLGVTSDTIVAALVNAVKALTARIAVLEGEPLKAAIEA